MSLDTEGLTLPLKQYTDYITDNGYDGYLRMTSESIIKSQKENTDTIKTLAQLLEDMKNHGKPED